jgi:alpha-L-rhamnosidase
VQLRSAYALNADGTLRSQDNRSAKTTDVYVLKGTGTESWTPIFRGQGYRFVEVTGFPGTPTSDNFEGLVMHTDFAAAGGFRCSNELVNRIHDNIRWTQRAYLRSVPMEPDRDERMGWLGTQAKDFESNCYNFDMAAFMGKWLEDIRLDQLEDGHIPNVSPTYWAMYDSGIVWPSNIAILPEIQYDFYADRRVLEANYEALTRWMNFISRHLKPDFTVDLKKFGDWCDATSMGSDNTTGGTADALIASAYFYNNCRITARLAGLLGKPDDATSFSERAAKIKDGFNNRFFDAAKHTYGTGSQTSILLPLAFGMVPPEQRAAVAGNLASDILVTRKGHLSVGMVGVFWLMQVLTETGHADAAWEVVTQTTRPSWGYMISKGATTVWERWDSDTCGPGMNSEALLILAGNLDAWFYCTLAGINYDPEQPGFKHIIIKPAMVGDLTWVKCGYDSIQGRIVSNWKRESDKLTMEVTIPINTTATVYVPAKDAASVTESGQPTEKAQGVKFLRMENDAAVYTVGSGAYQFQSTLSPRMEP